MPDTKKQMSDSKKPSRSDGRKTREAILQSACEIFAEKGYAAAECGRIAARAGTGIASINYHFGGKPGLYVEALIRAHGQLISLQTIRSIADAAPASPYETIRLFYLTLIRAARGPGHEALRMFMREIASPTPALREFLERSGNEKLFAMRSLIARFAAIDPHDPRAGQLMALIMSPCILALALDSDNPGPIRSLSGLPDEELSRVLARNAMAILRDAADRSGKEQP